MNETAAISERMNAMDNNKINDTEAKDLRSENISENENPAESADFSEEVPEYNPFTGMFSDNPFDLNTGEFIKNEKILSKPAVDLKAERKRKWLAFGIMATIIIPIIVLLYYSSTTTLKQTNLILNDMTILLGFIFLGAVASILGAFFIIRYNDSIGSKLKLKIDSRVFYMGFPSALICATLVTPDYSYVGNVICIALLIASIVSFLYIFINKLSLGSKVLCAIAFLLMAVISFWGGAYEKLTLHPFPIDSEYIILTMRNEEQLPPDTDKCCFISTDIRIDKHYYSEYSISDYETYQKLIQEDNDYDYDNKMVDPVSNTALELNNIIKRKMAERAAHFDKQFFVNNDLCINIINLPQYANNISIINSNVLRNAVQYELSIDYVEPVKNHYFTVDIGIEFVTIPKDSNISLSYTIKENTTGHIYRNAA